MVCVSFCVCVSLSAGQWDNRWPPVRSHQVVDLSLQLAGPAHPYQHYRLRVLSRQVSGQYHRHTFMISHTHLNTHAIDTSSHQTLPHNRASTDWKVSRSVFLCSLFIIPSRADLTWNFLPSCPLDITSKSEYRSASVPILYPPQLL